MILRRVILSTTILSLIIVTAACESKYEGVPRTEPEKVKSMLGSPDLMLVDVRAAKDWEGSDSKVKEALREDPKTIDEWAARYPKDKTIVFYCA